MNFTNGQILLGILILIMLTFVYSYDIYIVDKNVQLCKPIYVKIRDMNTESENNLIDSEVLEGFNNLMGESLQENSSYDTPQQLSTFIVPNVTDELKIKVIDSTVKVLSNIPTTYDIYTIKQLIEYFAIIYQTSSTLEIFYQNIASSTKIRDHPYNSKYAQLILFLIGKFNNDIENCSNSCSVKPNTRHKYISDENSSNLKHTQNKIEHEHEQEQETPTHQILNNLPETENHVEQFQSGTKYIPKYIKEYIESNKTQKIKHPKKQTQTQTQIHNQALIQAPTHSQAQTQDCVKCSVTCPNKPWDFFRHDRQDGFESNSEYLEYENF